jgi:hypothetical protein
VNAGIDSFGLPQTEGALGSDPILTLSARPPKSVASKAPSDKVEIVINSAHRPEPITGAYLDEALHYEVGNKFATRPVEHFTQPAAQFTHLTDAIDIFGLNAALDVNIGEPNSPVRNSAQRPYHDSHDLHTARTYTTDTHNLFHSSSASSFQFCLPPVQQPTPPSSAIITQHPFLPTIPGQHTSPIDLYSPRFHLAEPAIPDMLPYASRTQPTINFPQLVPTHDVNHPAPHSQSARSHWQGFGGCVPDCDTEHSRNRSSNALPAHSAVSVHAGSHSVVSRIESSAVGSSGLSYLATPPTELAHTFPSHDSGSSVAGTWAYSGIAEKAIPPHPQYAPMPSNVRSLPPAPMQPYSQVYGFSPAQRPGAHAPPFGSLSGLYHASPSPDASQIGMSMLPQHPPEYHRLGSGAVHYAGMPCASYAHVPTPMPILPPATMHAPPPLPGHVYGHSGMPSDEGAHAFPTSQIQHAHPPLPPGWTLPTGSSSQLAWEHSTAESGPHYYTISF